MRRNCFPSYFLEPMIKKNNNIKPNRVQGKRLNVFVLFLFLSFLISLLVKLSNTYTQTLQFELNPTQLESNEVMVSKEAKTINVTISGKGFELLKYYVEAARLIISHGFISLGMQRIYSGTFNKDIHDVVCRMLEFKSEGVKRSAVFKDGKFHDVYTHSMLRYEFLSSKIYFSK